MSTPAVSPTSPPLISFAPPGKANIQTRLAEIMAQIMHVLSESSRNEREYLNDYKAQIKACAENQASARGAQGYIALGSGAFSLLTALIPIIPGVNRIGEFGIKALDAANGSISKYCSSQFDKKDILEESLRQSLLRELDNLNSDIQGKTSTRRELLDLLDRVLQLALSASRPS